MQFLTTHSEPTFLKGGGKMGHLTRLHDWGNTSLGTPNTWPQSLQTTLSLVLNSVSPAFLFWGNELTCFYNDAFSLSMDSGNEHAALGSSGAEVWSDVWESTGPLIQQIRTTGDPVYFDDQFIPMPRKNQSGELYWSSNFSPVYGADGQVDGVLILCQDITRQTKATNNLYDSYRHVRMIVELSPVNIAIFDGPQFVITQANERALAFWGLHREQVLNKPLFEALPEMTGQGFEELLTKVYTTGERFDAKEAVAAVDRNGRVVEVYMDFTYEAIRTTDGTITGILAVFVDITEQVVARKAIEESEARFRMMAEESDILIAMSNEAAETTYLNQAWEELTGRSVADLMKFGWIDLMHPADREAFLSQYMLALKKQESFSGEFRILNKHQVYRWLLVKCPARFRPGLEGQNDVFVGYISSAIDITEHKKTEETLRASEAKLQSVVRTAPVAIGLFMGRDLVIELPNQTFIDIVGKGPSIAGKPLREVMPELLIHSQPFLQILDDVFTSGKQFNSYGSMVQIMKQGVMTNKYYNITYTPLFNEAGDVYAILDIAVDVTEQILAQQQLEKSQQQVLDLFEQSPVGIAIIDKENLTYRMANPFYSELTGRAPNELIGKPLLEAIPELQGQGFDGLLNEVFNTGIPFIANELSAQILRNGRLETIYVDFTYQPLHETSIKEVDNTFSSILVVTIDVTQQVISRQKIEESEAKLRSAVESAPFPIAVYTGSEMRIELANQSVLDTWGKGNDVIGKRYSDVLPELANQQIFTQLDAVYRTGIPFHAKNQRVDLLMDGNSKPFYFNYSFTPLFDATGQVYGVMNTAADVTDLVVAKQQVEEAEVSLRGAIELAELGTWELDVASNTVTYSDRVRAWFGFSSNTEDNEVVYNPIYEKDRARVQAAILNALQPESSGTFDEEYALVDKQTGLQRLIHSQGVVIYDTEGKPIKLTGMLQDITEQRIVQKELERQVQERTRQLQESVRDLQRSNQNLQQFAYVASHDLQEPLRKIQSFGDLLRNQYAHQLGEGGVDFLHRMQTSAGRMSTLIKDLLTYSRISTQQDSRTAVALPTIIQPVLTDLELIIQDTSAVVEVGDLPTVQGDRSQLGQLFQNLLSNALKFRKPTQPPHIRIRCQTLPAAELPAAVRPSRESALYYRIDVSDNGIGFDQQHVERIFQVFQRLHGKNQFAGTGIGLAICEKVAANHGGAITATSGLNEGATFSVYLPK